MPNYIFKHPDKEEYEEVFFHMNDEPKAFSDENGVEWQRIFGSPQLNTAGKLDPWNSNDFVNKTRDKKGSYGDLLDASAEMSEKRAEQRDGIDPVKQKYYDDYAKKRGGQRHMKEIKDKGFENKNVKIDFERQG